MHMYVIHTACAAHICANAAAMQFGALKTSPINVVATFAREI